MFDKLLEECKKLLEEPSEQLEKPFSDPEAELYTKTFLPTGQAGKMIEAFLLRNGYEEGKDFPIQGCSSKYPDIYVELLTGMQGYGMNVLSTTNRWESWGKLKQDLLKEYPELVFSGSSISVGKKSHSLKKEE